MGLQHPTARARSSLQAKHHHPPQLWGSAASGCGRHCMPRCAARWAHRRLGPASLWRIRAAGHGHARPCDAGQAAATPTPPRPQACIKATCSTTFQQASQDTGQQRMPPSPPPTQAGWQAGRQGATHPRLCIGPGRWRPRPRGASTATSRPPTRRKARARPRAHQKRSTRFCMRRTTRRTG